MYLNNPINRIAFYSLNFACPLFEKGISAFLSFPFSYLVVLPGTGTEGTGGLTACAQEATPAAAGCAESSCPAEKKSKGNNKTQGFMLLTQHLLTGFGEFGAGGLQVQKFQG